MAAASMTAPALALPQSTSSAPLPSVAQRGGALLLQLRRGANSVDVVVEGTGAAPVLRQRQTASGWQGQLQLNQSASLKVGPQTLTLPEAGLKRVSITGSGQMFQLEVVPMPGAPASKPVVSADGRNLILSFSAPSELVSKTATFNLNQPGSVPQPRYAPPLQPRAVAPPLGDMAVGTMVLRNRSYLNLSGPPVTMTLRNAPAKDALMALSQMGGYGFVYVDDEERSGAAAASAQARSGPTVSLSFRGETYSKALNSVLLASGLQGRMEGNLLLAGPSVMGKTFGAQMSKVYRLNQASAESAAKYLASLGARITQVTTITNAVTSGQPVANQVAGGEQTQQTKRETITTTETYGASAGPLRGLIGTTDSRLRTITLVGDSQMVSVAENYLRQIDLRQRQVALSVKILDVTLNNDASLSNSFAFRSGSNFVVSDRGEFLGAFGGLLPPQGDQFSTIAGGAASAKAEVVTAAGREARVAQETINANSPAPVNPGVAYPTGGGNSSNYFDFVRGLIESNTTKVLASPTLIINENSEPIASGAAVSVGGSGSAALNTASIGRPYANESFVTVGAQEIVSYTVQAGQNGAPNSCQPEFGTAGLTFGARVSRIDDNGFVTFSMSPEISAVIATDQLIAGCGTVNTLTTRRLDTGEVRVRDGQTLILTGVISDSDQAVVRKWPILGDIPFVGQFFRNSINQREKRELVILVSPRIIRDDNGGNFGYGYQAATPEARQLVSPY
ncbi:general secretion pathway protein GspD [Synechococcus sp. A10-1-5-1]|uniref:general secretion pathway protein GspD n=1 Tax=Synechococcus sp. A10-1-5-1 TaxID=2936507 RepID=UPI002000892A|nr:general secretion pathway protein GspD [Synechococcus sp. A10-1-5-1]UPM49574.1 general secretion pathway protein GspD [Synechococcus sp. A10-1-5-1]